MLVQQARVLRVMEPVTRVPVGGRAGIWPEMKIRVGVRMAWDCL